jgi:signal transduction histidine kinase
MPSESFDSNPHNEDLDVSESLEHIVGTLIHEINAPLGTALAAVQIAKRLSPQSAIEVRQWLDQSAESIRQAARLTKRMKALCQRSHDQQAICDLLLELVPQGNSLHA